MKAHIMLAAMTGAALCLNGCEENGTPNNTTPPPDTTTPNRTDTPAAKVPMDQNATDTRITGDVRRVIIDDATLSAAAPNIKVSAESGRVTLQGTVTTQQQKDAIEAKVKTVPGVVSVNNELEVSGG